MKTKVTSDSSTESVPSQTTAVTTSAGQSSVWSICDISTDTHVELRDITPSISPVFTDDQVHELTRTSSEVDVLGEHFLPPGTFKRIDEVLSSDGQSNLLYSDPVLRSALKSSNHDVLLPEELSFHGSMFPSFDSIVEADRILNKRDEQADVIHSEVDGDLESADLSKKSGSSVNNASNKAADDDGNTSGTDSKLRRSPRKRVQAKKDSDVLKSAPLAQKSISRGKDISKLKYANTEEEAPRKEVRRSGRGQKKIVKEDTDTDKKEKESAGNTKKKNKKGDITDDESSGKQDSLSKNVRRSPRNQSKAQEEDKKKATSKKEEKAEKTNSSCTENKEAPSGNETSKSKTQEQANKNKASGNKSDVEEKKGIRKSGRITRNKENQQKEEDEEKTVDESSDGNEKQSKGKAEGKKAKTAKVKIEEESVKDESSEKLKVKIGNKNDTENELVKQEVELNDSDSKAVGRRKVDSIKKEASYGEEMVKTRRGKSANKEKKEKENDADNKSDRESEEKLKESTKIEDPAIEVKEDKVVSDKEDHRPVEGSTKKVDAEGIKSKIKQEDISENLSPTKENLKDEKLGQTNDEPQDESSDEPEEEEYNEDSDYDPEYDPDRLWCVCRKPHGNKFMICCDHCEEWFHGICVGITMAQGRQMERNGQEYTCPKCKAKIEEEKKKGKPLTDPPGKENDESAGSTEQGEKSPSKHYHPSRKDHSLKIKLPSPEKRKRRLRQSRDEIFEDVSSKRRKESDKHLSEHIKEAKTSKAPESQGFRIPKKVRTTPTPALHSHPPARQKCIRTGCSMLAEHYSLYCSHECIHRYAEESVNVILEEKRKRSGCRSSVSSSKNVTSPSPTVLGSSHWDSQQPTGSSHSESSQLREGIAVIERSTGRVIAGVAAPSQEELVHWLQDHPSFEVLCPTVKDDRKKEKKEDSEKTVRESIRKSLKDILTTRSKDQPDVNVSGEEIDKCSLNVEGEMYSFFGDTGHRYKNKYRSLMFNLKDPRNKVLFRHVLSGEITVDRLVRMTPEQLASPELATWREQETKHTLEMIKMNQEEINATKAHIKKTHKGEVEIDDDDLSSLENSVKANAELKVEKDLPDSNTSPNILFLDTTDEHRIHLFDLNCRICTGKMAPPGEPPRRETPSPLVSTTSIVQAVAESSMPSPTPMEISTSANSPDSATVSQRPVSPSVLSKTQKKVPAVWKGFVMMQGVAKFGTSAYRVSGSCDDLLHLLPDTLHVQGRIAHDQVWDYLTQLKSSTSREVCVIRYEASSDDEKLSYVSLYSYFYSRKRCGVVSNCYTGVKDMYLVPLASHQAIPPELLPFDGPGLDEPRPHMLLGVIVRSKALFKRPRALSQRSLSPPPKRRTSSASAETNSSDGGTGDSPSRKSGDTSFSELRDSPPADIDDIVFQYNTTQAKMASKVGKESPVKASPLSETIASPTSSKDSSSVPSLEAQKQQLLDLQERARQYILAQTQRKQTASEELQGQSLKITDSSDATKESNEEGKSGGDGDDDDAPYDPEEGLNLDLDVTDPTPTKPVVAAQPEEPPKPSSLEMLVSTLQKLQGVAPNLSALTSLLPKVSTTTSGGPAGRSLLTSETKSATAISSLGSGAHLGKPLTTEPGTSALASGILQPVAAVNSLLQPVTSSSSTSQATVSTDHRSHQAVSGTRGSQLSPISAQRLRLSSQRLQQQEVERPQAGSSLDNRAHIRPSPGQHYGDHRSRYGGTSDYIQKPGSSSAQGNQADSSEISFANRWNPSEPPQVNRQVNTASQEIAQYSGLRPEERARLAAHESRLESRENTRSSEHREENYDQRRSNDRQRSNWHNDSRFPRDSRNSRDDSRRPFREEYRHGRPWCGDDQRRDRFEQDRSRQNDRGRERRFKEHWSRDRWRR